MVPLHTKNFSTLAQLKVFIKRGTELNFGWLIPPNPPPGRGGELFQKLEEMSYRTVIQTHIENFNAHTLIRKCSKIGGTEM